MDPYPSQHVHEDEYGWSVQPPWEGEPIYSDEKGEYFTREGVEYFRPWNYDLWWVYRKGLPPRAPQQHPGYQHTSGYQQHSSSQKQSGYQTQQGYQQWHDDQQSRSSKRQQTDRYQGYESNRSARKAPSSEQKTVKLPPPPPRPSHLRDKRVLRNLSENARKKHVRAEKEGRQPPLSRTFSWKDQATEEELAYYDYETKYQWHIVNAATGARKRELNRLPQGQDGSYGKEEAEEEEDENGEGSAHAPRRPKNVRELRVLKNLCEGARVKHNRSIEKAVKSGLKPPLPSTFSWRDYATKEEIEYHTALMHTKRERSADFQRGTRHEPQQIYESGSFITERFPTPPPPPPVDENCRRVRKVNIASSLGIENTGLPSMSDGPSWRAEANEEERLYFDYE